MKLFILFILLIFTVLTLSARSLPAFRIKRKIDFKSGINLTVFGFVVFNPHVLLKRIKCNENAEKNHNRWGDDPRRRAGKPNCPVSRAYWNYAKAYELVAKLINLGDTKSPEFEKAMKKYIETKQKYQDCLDEDHQKPKSKK